MKEKKCNLCYIRQLVVPVRHGKSAFAMEPYNNDVIKPTMGWSSWNCFRNNIDQEKILSVAEALVKTKLSDKGYKFVNLDDNWQSSIRDKDGNLQGDLDRFGMGMPAFIKKVNDMGLKVGLYSSNGTLTCEDLPASLGNEERDAYTIAKWGAELLKYDFCHHHPYTPKAPLISTITLTKCDLLGNKIELVASEGILGGKAKIVKDSKMPCGSYVKGLDANAGIIVFDSVTTDKEGEYVFTLTVKKHGNYEKFLVVEVNGETQMIVAPPCKRFNNTARVQCVVRLISGNNTIKLYNPMKSVSDGYIMQYMHMGKMLKKASKRVSDETQMPQKPIVYSICEWGRNKPWIWGPTVGNQWRTTLDIRPWWWWMMIIYRHTTKLYDKCIKGGYNDPDMLEVGNGNLSYEENKSHFTLWAMMNAPLILGNDIRKFIKKDGTVDEDNEILKILTNEKIIALNQDEKCKAAKRVKKGIVDVLAKPVTSGTAFCFFNHAPFKKRFKCDIKDYVNDKYVRFPDKDIYKAEDLWTGERLETNGKIDIVIPAHGVIVYKVK